MLSERSAHGCRRAKHETYSPTINEVIRSYPLRQCGQNNKIFCSLFILAWDAILLLMPSFFWWTGIDNGASNEQRRNCLSLLCILNQAMSRTRPQLNPLEIHCKYTQYITQNFRWVYTQWNPPNYYWAYSCSSNGRRTYNQRNEDNSLCCWSSAFIRRIIYIFFLIYVLLITRLLRLVRGLGSRKSV